MVLVKISHRHLPPAPLGNIAAQDIAIRRTMNHLILRRKPDRAIRHRTERIHTPSAKDLPLRGESLHFVSRLQPGRSRYCLPIIPVSAGSNGILRCDTRRPGKARLLPSHTTNNLPDPEAYDEYAPLAIVPVSAIQSVTSVVQTSGHHRWHKPKQTTSIGKA